MAEKNIRQEMAQEVSKAFGQNMAAAGVPQEPQNQRLLSFSSDRVFLSLKIVTPVDAVTGEMKPQVPRITASFNGEFVEYPISGKFWKDYALFVADMAEALDGVEIKNKTISADVDSAKKAMAQFKNIGA